MESNVKLYSLSCCQVKTYFFTLLFIAGNTLFPQLCHLVPNGGLLLLPIYFFTLIGGYKYGFWVGLFTGLLSPFACLFIIGPPPFNSMLIVIMKSIMLGGFSAYVAHHLDKVSFLGILAIVFTYQLLGMIVEWAITGDLVLSAHNFTMSIPGMLLQIFGGYALLRWIARF